jgi:hypothetical protein
MSLAHNGIIRGLNSLYLQAPHLPQHDVATARDFLTYCQCWSESMHHHHDAEEEIFFPAIESITGVAGLMEQNIEQHRAFTPGFEAFERYCRTCPPEEFDGQKLRSLFEGFAEALVKHLHDEIETLRALDGYDSTRLREAYEAFVKSLMATDNVSLLLPLSLPLCLSLSFPPFSRSHKSTFTDFLMFVFDTATHRALGLWNCGPELRKWRARLSRRAFLRAVGDSLCFRQEASGRLEVQSLYAVAGEEGVGVWGVMSKWFVHSFLCFFLGSGPELMLTN